LSVLHTYGTSPEFLNFSGPDYRFQTIVTERSGGRIQFDTLTDAMPQGEFPLAVSEGRADMANFHPVLSAGTFPFWDMAGIPFLFKTVHDYELFIQDARLREIWDADYRKHGIQLLAPYGCDGLNAVWAKKAMPNAADFEGLKIRGAGYLPVATMNAMGAAPVTLFQGAAEAVQKGTIDAGFFDHNFGYAQGMADVTSYLNRWVFTPSFADSIIINADKFDSMPADLQQLLLDMSQRFAHEDFYATIISNLLVEQAVERQGLTIVVPDESEVLKAKEMTKNVHKEWLDKIGDEYRSLGEEVLEIARSYSPY
jgi:TRAP-type C4-dicarboxylate transport system substrate-binding protein